MDTVIIQLLTALVGSLGFSLIFNVSRKHIVPCTLGGLLCWGVYLFFADIVGLDIMAATILAAAAGEVYAEVLARTLKAPTTVFYIPAVVPLIPGGALYNTMQSAVNKDWQAFRYYGSNTLQVTLGIAIGISFVSAVLHMVSNIMKKRKH